MKKCYIDFPNEVCEGYIGTKEDVENYVKRNKGQCSYEGKHRIRNRELHKWEEVIVYSDADYFFGTSFVCYKAEEETDND